VVTQVEIRLTDHASELVKLGDALLALPVTGEPGFKVVGDWLSLNPDSVEFIELLAAVSNRIASFSRFVMNLDDDVLTTRVRVQTQSAALQIGRLMGPTLLGQAWNNARNHLNETHLGALDAFAQTARRHRPLRLLSEEERTATIAKVQELILDLESDEDLPSWARAPIKEGLIRLGSCLII
jgi:hypothetical protein